ncbi:hypothetical protein [Chitinophaga caseinilytica]|uniref:Uncharacterized protein n=1 Tax=Chitinophaga caseinilytica TaxID=2267521 RepID=A0ABZ2Z4C3_9BACT
MMSDCPTESHNLRRRNLLPPWAYLIAGIILLTAGYHGWTIAEGLFFNRWVHKNGGPSHSLEWVDLILVFLLLLILCNMVASVALFLRSRRAISLALVVSVVDVVLLAPAVLIFSVDLMLFSIMAFLLLALVLYLRALWPVRDMWKHAAR